MRLLQCNDDGEPSLTDDYGDEDETPSYAILSHTWGADGDEVTFEDLAGGTGKAKPGYEKIRFCGEQARRNNLKHFWVDTCCIDKADKSKLSKAIQSMFRWYRNAARCYVYLPDVSRPLLGTDEEANPLLWESQFRKSKWFTRGWTLQELLAPSSVEFFSREGQRLGDKNSLREQIYRITNIPYAAIEGAPLSQFTVNERLQWKEYRVTKHEEDGAYSLLGIFDVYLAPLYGEGAAGAFRRLMNEIQKQERCIQDIRSTDPRDDKKRIEDTKGGLLKESYCWVLENASFQQWRSDPQSQLLWIKGDPGKGKTMLICGIIDELQKATGARAACVSYFFCQATDSRINNATAALRGLLYLLVSQQPALISHARKKHDHAGKSMFKDPNAWVTLTAILADVLQDPSLNTSYLIVDALDECVTDLPKLLSFVTKYSSTSTSSRVKWIVSSRNWPGIEEQLEQAGDKVRLSLELNAESVSAAVSVFIEQKVSQLAQQKKYDNQTRDAVLERLTSGANNTFLWVALVCQELRATARRNVLKKLDLFPPGLDALYRQMAHQISKSDDAELCKHVLGIIALVYRPITLQELVALAEQLQMTNESELQEIIDLCGSFLTLQGKTIYFVHQSAKDFLFAKAVAEVFPSGVEVIHHAIFARSLQAMSKTLQRDIYGLQELGMSIEEFRRPKPDPLAALRYSCIYWVDHLCNSKPMSSAVYPSCLHDKGALEIFLKEKYLYWLEAISIYRSVPNGVLSMGKLQLLLRTTGESESLRALVYDAYRFIMYHKGAIESSPLQTYVSALLFSPTGSLVRKLFKHEEPIWFTTKPTIGDNWNACLQTLEGHSENVCSVTFSHDSTWLASASGDNSIKIWDVSSGACLQTLKGHSDWVSSVAFSHDSTRLATASHDKTVKIWDANSGVCLRTLKGHRNWVNSVAFSHDSTLLASASEDKTIKVWDASSGACLQTLKGHSSSIWSVAFSHDSTWLASGSNDETVKLWDASDGTCLRTLKGHIGFVSSVAFSHDSTRLASAAGGDETVKIWDGNGGMCLYTLEGHSHQVYSVAFSHNSTLLASASHDKTIKVWDASSGACLQTLKGHSSSIRCVAFSHDSTRLASASDDETVKLWDASGEACVHTLEDHNRDITSMALSRDSAQLASASDDETVKIWDASGACLYTLEGHSDSVVFVVFSHDSTQLATASNKTIKIWDTSSGACLRTLKGHSKSINSMIFSHNLNLTWLATASYDKTIKIWDTSSGACLRTLKGHSRLVTSIAFSHKSAWLASASEDMTIKIWDISTGVCLQTLKGHNGHVAFSHDSTRLATASNDKTIKIWDTSSGVCQQTLKGHSEAAILVAFSHDSTRLATSSYDKTVKIWDASSGACLRTLETGRLLDELSFDSTGSCLNTEIGTIAIRSIGASSIIDAAEQRHPQYLGIGVSFDNMWITYNGKNRLWLPSEYRPSHSCVYMDRCTVSIGVKSGKVWMCRIRA